MWLVITVMDSRLTGMQRFAAMNRRDTDAGCVPPIASFVCLGQYNLGGVPTVVELQGPFDIVEGIETIQYCVMIIVVTPNGGARRSSLRMLPGSKPGRGAIDGTVDPTERVSRRFKANT